MEDAYEEIKEWLEKPKKEAREYIGKINKEIKKIKGLSSHRYSEFDSLKKYGTFRYLIKPETKKIYILYDIVNDTIILKYIKPCSQAYNYDDV